MDTQWELSLLLDFYGAFLTERQRELCDLSFNQDLSLSEIAENTGISRQAVHDALRRAETTLHQLEEQTGCVARERQLQEALLRIQAAAAPLLHHDDPAVRAAADEIRSALLLLDQPDPTQEGTHGI